MSMSKHELSERQKRLSDVYRHQGDPERLAAYYDRWAELYDEDMGRLGYVNPAMVCGMAGRYVDDREAHILDAGAGSGIVGRLLALLGYRDLTGVDISPGMLERAAALDVYRQLRQMDLGQPLGFEDEEFDVCVACGVLTVGHAPPRALDELIRVARSGGMLIFSVTDQAYEETFGDKMRALEDAGRWRAVDASRPYVALPGAAGDSAHTSRMFVYRVS